MRLLLLLLLLLSCLIRLVFFSWFNFCFTKKQKHYEILKSEWRAEQIEKICKKEITKNNLNIIGVFIYYLALNYPISMLFTWASFGLKFHRFIKMLILDFLSILLPTLLLIFKIEIVVLILLRKKIKNNHIPFFSGLMSF